MDVDENGWATGKIEPLALASAWSLFAPEADARIDAARWAHHARKFFALELALVEAKVYAGGAFPLADACDVVVGRAAGAGTRVRLVTVPIDRAGGARAAGLVAARAPFGAGFDALVLRARRLWQVAEEPVDGGDGRAPLALSAVLASVLLAPIVPPREAVIFGVKTARERLVRLGYET